MNKSLFGLLSLFFLAFLLFVTTVLFRGQITQFTRAKEELSVSSKDSLLFAWPLTLSADGNSKSVITIFVRSSTSKPLSSKVTTLSTTLGTLSSATATTDKEGKATFALSSSISGTAEIKASVEGIPLDKGITVKFE